MWKLLEQAAKTATANASEYVSTVQVKAQSIVASVQDEAATLLHAIGTARTGPVDELLYEEIDDYKVFSASFVIDDHTEEISKILSEDDEIRGLHEQMVPVQLSYEEFWCRYFFRREQQEMQRAREVERKRAQSEAKAAAKAASKAAPKIVLEEFEVDDDDEDFKDEQAVVGERDALASGQRGGEHAGQDDGVDAHSQAKTQLQQRESQASRKAAQQWKQKALEYQKQLNLLAEQSSKENELLKASMETKYQSLCESYETKMTEMTLQIDEARAVGYDAGIQESEAIISTMREQAEQDVERLQMQVAQLQQPGVSLDDETSCTVTSAGVLRVLEEQKEELEHAVAAKDAALQDVQQQLAALAVKAQQSETVESELHAAKKEIELWKLRAVKMKKIKEQLDSEIQMLKDQVAGAPSPDVATSGNPAEEIAALQATIEDLEEQNRDLADQLAEAAEAQRQVKDLMYQLELAEERIEATAKESFERGVEAGQEHVSEEVQKQHQAEVAKAFEDGEARATALYTCDLELMRSELAFQRADRLSIANANEGDADILQSLQGDILAQADAVLSGLESPTEPAKSGEPVAADWGEW